MSFSPLIILSLFFIMPHTQLKCNSANNLNKVFYKYRDESNEHSNKRKCDMQIFKYVYIHNII